MIKHRLNRLFNLSGNCLDVAIDHGFFNERSFLNGIENMEQAIHTIVIAQLLFNCQWGRQKFCKEFPGNKSPR
jgi:class I fructose-bisphosphate aldolase